MWKCGRSWGWQKVFGKVFLKINCILSDAIRNTCLLAVAVAVVVGLNETSAASGLHRHEPEWYKSLIRKSQRRGEVESDGVEIYGQTIQKSSGVCHKL